MLSIAVRLGIPGAWRRRRSSLHHRFLPSPSALLSTFTPMVVPLTVKFGVTTKLSEELQSFLLLNDLLGCAEDARACSSRGRFECAGASVGLGFESGEDEWESV